MLCCHATVNFHLRKVRQGSGMKIRVRVRIRVMERVRVRVRVRARLGRDQKCQDAT